MWIALTGNPEQSQTINIFLFCYWQRFLPYLSHYLMLGKIELSIIWHKVIKKFGTFFWKNILMLAGRRWDFWSEKSCFWFGTNFTYKILCAQFLCLNKFNHKNRPPSNLHTLVIWCNLSFQTGYYWRVWWSGLLGWAWSLLHGFFIAKTLGTPT